MMEIDRLIGFSKRLRRVRSVENEVRQTWGVSTTISTIGSYNVTKLN
jgi:hypothetical protein